MEYRIIAADDHMYGPIDLATLRQWVADKRVDAQTWIHESTPDGWIRASKVAGLADMFAAEKPAAPGTPAEGGAAMRPGQLRRLKVFADMSDDLLARFLTLVEKVQVRTGTLIVKVNEQGDCMYMLLEGVVRVRLGSSGKETELARLEAGEFFGEICLFDEGPRSADVVANTDCTLLKITKRTFHSLMEQQPDVAVRFLFAIIRTVEARIRNQNKKYSDSMSWGRSWGAGSPALASAAAAAGASARPQARL